MRENGLYWVKFKEGSEWGVGGYKDGYWLLIGTDESFSDTDFDEIGDMIQIPED